MLSGKPATKEEYFRHLFDTCFTRMYFYALGILHSREEAEDTVQEVFVRFWEKRGELTFAEERIPYAYLLASVRNACLDRIEKKKLLLHDIDAMNLAVLDEDIALFDEELIQRIRTEIENMPSQTRNVVVGIMLEKRKYREVADILGISVNSVKTLLGKGIKRLRERFLK
ncbi:MAG: sigma-70 family RNA polymerase sigma factor [Rikenellaceae bacterium]|nr:sigma-70 family RNA polymerase sigma factor [Rikenellaceae bacterium]MCL2692494.1 sigma-70 family RNA polymerase sigma factor [Rikenellaceae bacterium]